MTAAADLLLDQLRLDVDAIGRVLTRAPGAAVTHCPGWSVADLVRHHGDVHRWATAIVATGRPDDVEHGGPEDPALLAEWYAEGAAALLEVLVSTDPERECWTFGRPPGRAWFWTRRQALEAAVHRWDAEAAVGTPAPLPDPVADAGITEVAEDLYPRQVALGRTPPLPAPLSLTAIDSGRTWTIAGDGSTAAGAPAAGATVGGPAERLLLLLWRRVALDDTSLEVSGPPAVLAAVRGACFAP